MCSVFPVHLSKNVASNELVAKGNVVNLCPIKSSEDQVIPIVQNEFQRVISGESTTWQPAAGANDVNAAPLRLASHRRRVPWIGFEVTRHNQDMRSSYVGNRFLICPANPAIRPLYNHADVGSLREPFT